MTLWKSFVLPIAFPDFQCNFLWCVCWICFLKKKRKHTEHELKHDHRILVIGYKLSKWKSLFNNVTRPNTFILENSAQCVCGMKGREREKLDKDLNERKNIKSKLEFQAWTECLCGCGCVCVCVGDLISKFEQPANANSESEYALWSVVTRWRINTFTSLCLAKTIFLYSIDVSIVLAYSFELAAQSVSVLFAH